MKKETITGKEVRYILRQNRVNLRQLADAIGISPQALNSRLNATVFSPLHLDEITDALGRDLFGSNDTKERTSTIPVLDLRVCAGNGIGLEGDENQITEYVTIPSMKGCYGLTVYGDSMLPRYHPGDIVFVRPIPDSREIDFGHTYLVITQSDRLLKAREIIDKYMDKRTGHISLPDIKYVSLQNVINKNLKAIGKELSIRNHERLCWYTARKSFVQHGFELGITLEVLEYTIGQSVKTNRPIFNYLKIMRRHADDAIRRIIDNLQQSPPSAP